MKYVIEFEKSRIVFSNVSKMDEEFSKVFKFMELLSCKELMTKDTKFKIEKEISYAG